MTDEKVDPFSLVAITLLKGVTYRDDDLPLWQSLLQLQARLRDHVAPLALELIVDEAEGYAYLRQRETAEGEPALPRLVPRRPLSYPVSLLLALLRKKLVEFDAKGGDTRLVLDREEIVDLVRVFLPSTPNEARLMDRLDAAINKIAELGFLRRLRGQRDRFEVRRIIKAFVDGQWLHEFDRRLASYRDPSCGVGGKDAAGGIDAPEAKEIET